MTLWKQWLTAERKWTGFIAVVIVLGGFWTWWARVPEAAPGQLPDVAPHPGFQAPGFALATLDGSETTLSSHLGQVVVLNLWATWCAPCRAEMPALERVWRQYHDQGLVVLGVNQRESPERVQAFVSELGLTFPILLDRDGSVGATYRMRALPTTFFIDRDGEIREVIVGGPLAEGLIASKVTALLGE